MALQMLETREVVDKLTMLGSDWNPVKQAYKAEIAGKYVELFDPNAPADDGLPSSVRVRAENVEHYVKKGFLVDRPTAAAKRKGR